MSYPYYDPTVSFQAPVNYAPQYIPATYMAPAPAAAPAPTVVETKNFVVEPAKLTKSEQLKKNQDDFKALSDKAFALSQSIRSEVEKYNQELERWRFKQDQDLFSYRQRYDQLIMKAGLHQNEKDQISINQERLKVFNLDQNQWNLLLLELKSVQQLPGAVVKP